MNVFVSLAAIGAIPVAASLILAELLENSPLKKWSYTSKQILAGLIFGAIAICGTEFGVPFEGAIINARDAAPLCAGLIFGAPAGIIAGVIGGVERWFAVFWGAGYYTRLGCTISTILTGVIAAVLRRYMYEDEIPGSDQAVLIAAVCEIIHMLMIFVTNISDVRTAFSYVRTCTVPMVVINALAVFIAVFAVNWYRMRTGRTVRKIPSISNLFYKRLIAILMLGFIVISAFEFFLQYQIGREDTREMLSMELEDTERDVREQCNDTLLHVNHLVADAIERDPDEDLNELKTRYRVYEINVVNQKGIVVNSTNEAYIGRDMGWNRTQADVFMTLLRENGKDEVVEEFQPVSPESSFSLKYSGVRTADGFVQVAYDETLLKEELTSIMKKAVAYRHVGETGSFVVLDENNAPLSWTEDSIFGVKDPEVKLAEGKTEPHTVYEGSVDGEPYYYMYSTPDYFRIVGFIPKSEADFPLALSTYLSSLTQGVVFGVLFALIYIFINLLIVRNIRRINTSLDKIARGNLNTTVDVRNSREFISLSDGINTTVDALKRYIAEANTRIDNELHYAREIQSSALPSVFPDREEFDICALMRPAKEVGGDFYDFYLIEKNKLAFVVADVSGKGIPAALFMMRAKTTLKTYAENDIAVADIFTNANFELCEGKDAGLFVTAWMGFLDLETGELRYANAGHNKPLVRRKNGTFEYLEGNPGFVLGGLEGIAYKEQSLILEPGDEIFLYTDGVVEATNAEYQLYGDDRLKERLNTCIGEDARTVCDRVVADVDDFYQGAPQFDDLTELSVQFRKYSAHQEEA